VLNVLPPCGNRDQKVTMSEVEGVTESTVELPLHTVRLAVGVLLTGVDGNVFTVTCIAVRGDAQVLFPACT